MKRTTNKRRNSGLAQAAALSESFHQRPPRKVADLVDLHAEREDFAELGRLIKIEIVAGGAVYELPFSRGVSVLATPDGRNIYLKGGDQEIDLAGMGFQPKDLVTVGQAQSIEYHTKKGFHNFEPTDYTHQFGEDGGTLPWLLYDALNREMFLSGGSYEVKHEGIVN